MRVVLFVIFFIASSFCDLDNINNSRITNFSVELFYQTVQGSDRNVMIISPYAIWSLLISMAYETMDVTREEVSKVFLIAENRSEIVEGYLDLRSSLLRNEDAKITFLNSVFYDEDLDVYPDSIDRLKNDFSFLTQSLRFEERPEVAKFVQGCRPNWNYLRTDDFVNSTMIMCNCLTFEAEWTRPFTTKYLHPIKSKGDKSEIQLFDVIFTRTRLRFADLKPFNATFTELPYGSDGKYCMLLIRPYSGTDSIHVIGMLRTVPLYRIFKELQFFADFLGPREIDVALPGFPIESLVYLDKPLFDMGLSSVFNRSIANFDNFAGDKIYIGEITHRLMIQFTLNKTVVYTTTPAGADTLPQPRGEAVTPFIFFIIEKSTMTTLFCGSYS